ncbi:MAG TPA: GIY-YIG nuclease family protein [Sphingomicrobium sp.]|nr:GIY-YIG nuclease family protein [Sphingomicrobium sp.]
MGWGFVYVLANECMPGIYKIGMTEKAPQERLEQLSSATSIPLPFDMVFFAQVQNPLKVEQAMHRHFEDRRVNESREFFRASIKDIHDYLERTTEPFHIYEQLYQWELYQEGEREKAAHRQSLIDHFASQCHDPIHWPKTKPLFFE